MNGKQNSSTFLRSPELWFIISLVAIGILTTLGPPERTLGANARVVYLHGVWVWASLAGFLAAALSGGLGLAMNKKPLLHWSRALGRTGLFFWITYLPISMWAMQTNWNGLFLSEPRWRLALVFSVAGLLLQTGVTLLENPAWAAAGNLGYFMALIASLAVTENVMHPPAPILNSDAQRIQIFFLFLLLLTLLATGQVARWWYRLEPASVPVRRS